MDAVTLTVTAKEVIEKLKQWEAVPGVHGLHLQGRVHVGSVHRQKRFGVFCHQLRPPQEGLKTPQMRNIRLSSQRSFCCRQ